MGQFSMSSDTKIVNILALLSTAAAADRTSKVIDTKGYNSFCIIYQAGTHAADAISTLTVQRADAASDTDTLTSGEDVVGSSQTVAADDDDQVRYWDFQNIDDGERYYQLTVDKVATKNSDEGAVCVLYNTNSAPTTHADGTSTVGEGAGAVTGEAYTTAAAGTA